jgi:hypothetical protein
VRDGLSPAAFEQTREFLSKYSNILTATENVRIVPVEQVFQEIKKDSPQRHRVHGGGTKRNDEVGTMNDEVKKSCLTSSFIVPRSYFLLCAPSVFSVPLW